MHLEQYEPQAAWRSSIWMFVAGTAIGAVTALMMAPATGRESRDYIRKQGKKVAGDLGAHKDKAGFGHEVGSGAGVVGDARHGGLGEGRVSTRRSRSAPANRRRRMRA